MTDMEFNEKEGIWLSTDDPHYLRLKRHQEYRDTAASIFDFSIREAAKNGINLGFYGGLARGLIDWSFKAGWHQSIPTALEATAATLFVGGLSYGIGRMCDYHKIKQEKEFLEMGKKASNPSFTMRAAHNYQTLPGLEKSARKFGLWGAAMIAIVGFNKNAPNVPTKRSQDEKKQEKVWNMPVTPTYKHNSVATYPFT